jgi:putative membrane-bound dehydrogenase-like protein
MLFSATRTCWNARSLAGIATVALLAALHAVSFATAAEPNAGQSLAADSPAKISPANAAPPITVPAGYAVELVAGPPLVEHPLMASFDDRGRLYIAENAGLNLKRSDLEEQLPNYISRLEDTDGDGRFDRRTVFADKLTFPQGSLWHDGWLYVASSGAIWRFQDRNDDGVADVREKIVSQFGYTGNAADVHGCFLGPEGRIYWCEGRHGHEITDAKGNVTSKGKAARIFSCNPNGSDVQIHCGGGMDNPVEIDWTDEGEMLGTVNILYAKRGDCLVHWMHGGVYPRHDQPLVVAEFRRTGPLLDAVYNYGHVAVSGCCRYRSDLPPATDNAADKSEAKGKGAAAGPMATYFVTQFNTHKVVRTDLFRDGATFRPQTHDFLQAASDDFHPTDVLEDADGSLLVIDTGGWFRIGCPTSQIAKPNLLGAIYRVRKTARSKIDDPRGSSLAWDSLEAHQLIGLLADPRPVVRARASEHLAAQKNRAIAFLARAARDQNPAVRQRIIATLAKIDSPESQAANRQFGLADRDPAVVQTAVHSAGSRRDALAVDAVQELLAAAGTPPEIVREAATALGKIGDAAAVPAILARLRLASDRVLEHALIYALIEIDDRESIAQGLADDSPRVRRAALIALDQMPHGELAQEAVARLLDTSDEPLQSAALDVISRHAGWTDELVALAGRLLGQRELSAEQAALLSGSLVAFRQDAKVQALIAASLARPDLTTTTRQLLLDAIARSELHPLPAAWLAPLRIALAGDDDALAQAAIAALGADGATLFPQELLALARRADRSTDARLAALAVISRDRALAPQDFAWLTGRLSAEAPPLARSLAARTLASARLSPPQQAELLPAIRQAGPLEITSLVASFDKCQDHALLTRLVAAAHAAPGLRSLPVAAATSLIQRLPAAEQSAGREQLRDIFAAQEDQQARLVQLQSELSAGDPLAGREVFFGRRAACAACHRIGSEGGKVGPDLSTVGQRRNARDLLEAIAFPSASLARGYESLLIQTEEGRLLTGLVLRETADSLHLRTSDQTEIRLPRAAIVDLKPSSTSIMPAGLDGAMTREELSALLAFLQSLK